MMDKINEMLKNLVKGYKNDYYLNLRNTIKEDEWFDEIHPKNSGFEKISDKYEELIDSLK